MTLTRKTKIQTLKRRHQTNMPDPRDAIEREVQRRLTDYLVSAGVPQGRISLEVLYMLPTEFTRAYEELFSLSLKEGVTGGYHEGDGKRQVKNEMSRLTGKGKTKKTIGSRFLSDMGPKLPAAISGATARTKWAP